MKTITICDKEYPIDCNALTQIKYRNFFKKGIMEDIRVLQDYLVKQIVVATQIEEKQISEAEKLAYISNYMNQYIDKFVESITRITWIMIYTANKDIEEYEKWLKSIKVLKTDSKWIAEVAEFAVDCFC